MIENLDLLFNRMKASRPVLLLGAGFSYGATNANNTPLLLGKKLSQELHKYFFVEGELSTLDPTMLSEINDKEDDLKEICSYLRLCGKVLERNKFLTAAFKGCKPAPEGFHQKLVKYPWEYIFTLNIDDLVENIYRTAEIPLSVWDASNTTGTNYEHKTNLVKLHGSVNDSKNGYIFDSSEYKNFTIDSNSLLKEFAHQFLQHDLILIGTEFQEDDLQTVLDVYERSGYSKDPFHRFYISPNISTKLKLQIQNSPNDVFCLEIFCKKFSEVVSMSCGWVRLHRGRILNHLIDNDDTPLIKNVLHEAAVYAVPSDERIHTQTTEIFEKVLRVKHMRNSSLLPREEILDLLKGLENNCNHVSYFWVQYGIAAQINEEYEEANNHLLYAHSMRSKSYHVNHALANNELAWGLFLLKNKIGDGNTKFLNGADRMLKIVYNENFSGSYRYSVHSYVRMWLEYAKVTKENLPYETCEVCSNLLESLLDRPLDNMLTTLIKSFIAYCDSNNLKELNFKLKSVYRKREQFHADRGAYDID